MTIIEHLEKHRFSYQAEGVYIIIDGKKYFPLSPRKIVIKQSNTLNLFPQEYKLAEQADYVAYEFAGNWYYTQQIDEGWKMNPFLYLGKSKDAANIPYLGVHTRSEIGNVLGTVSNWTKKARFLGYQTLGCCDYNTLGGVFEFVTECEKANITPIVGGSFEVEGQRVKFYVRDQTGWKNLLKISKIKKIDRATTLNLTHLDGLNDGLVVVLPVEFDFKLLQAFKGVFPDLYYQVNPTEYQDEGKDVQVCRALEGYLQQYQDEVPGVLITDSYILEPEQQEEKTLINAICDSKTEYTQKDAHFRSFKEIKESVDRIAIKQEDFIKFVKNAVEIVEKCKGFEFDRSPKLPRYKMTEEEKAKFKTSKELFSYFIKQGIQKKVIEKGKPLSVYMERLQEELAVIQKANIIDYFLITKRDVIDFVLDRGYLAGLGRGSAAGCLVAWLLDITKPDPIEYQLYFSRFLNEGRIFKTLPDGRIVTASLPDIDIDCPSAIRNDVKDHIIEKYGKDNAAFIGTKMEFKLKAVIKEIGKRFGLSNKDVNWFTKMLPDTQLTELKSMEELIKFSVHKPIIKKFIKDNYRFFNYVQACLGAYRTYGVHAAAVIIVPNEDSEGNLTTIYDYLPCHLHESGNVVTDFSGSEIDKMGILKEDLLVIKELDKLQGALEMIEDMSNADFYEIPLNDSKPLEYFSLGYTEQTFQTNTPGMRSLLERMQPTRTDDIIAATALYRPGPMGSGMHWDYCDIKNGKEKPKNHHSIEHIVSNTYGLPIYQEQILAMFRDLGGFDLSTADIIRRALGKKDMKLLASYRDQFINEAKRQISEPEAVQMWADIEYFAFYSFNRAHSVCYGETAYKGQYLKAYYPLEFWTAALTQEDRQEKIRRAIGEIQRTGTIQVKAADVNYSDATGFVMKKEQNTIYASLTSVKQIAEAGATIIIEARNKYGKYTDLEDFLESTSRYMKEEKKRGVTSAVVTNLILCGGFDDIEMIVKPSDRHKLIEKYADLAMKNKPKETYLEKNPALLGWQYQLKQIELCGIGSIDFESLFRTVKVTYTDDFTNHSEYQRIAVAGRIIDVTTRNRKTTNICTVVLDSNAIEQKFVYFYKEEKNSLVEKIKVKKGSVALFEVEVQTNGYNQRKQLYFNEKLYYQLL